MKIENAKEAWWVYIAFNLVLNLKIFKLFENIYSIERYMGDFKTHSLRNVKSFLPMSFQPSLNNTKILESMSN